jgi:alpha-D-ribose 1-methylphosphonate 5-triphosphate synthase subunit PhnL
MTPMIRVRELSKTFVRHNQGGLTLPVLKDIDLDVAAGECVALHGNSGVGKSTLMRCLYANYRAQAGAILVRHDAAEVDMLSAPARRVLEVRRRTLGYVSQFLRVIPRVATIDIVAEPLRANGIARDEARETAAGLLERLNLPHRLWELPPATFSGGEQQRVNIARGFAHAFPILLLDEPTASLDPENRQVVIDLVREAREAGTAIIGIFHDADARAALATRLYTMIPAGRA